MSKTYPIDKIKERLSYDPESGTLTWRVDVARNVKAGAVAGSLNNRGRLNVSFDNRPFQAHRVIWAMVYGYWPEMIDHIDGNPQNNRLINLRAASALINSQNRRKPSKANTTGYLGVYRIKDEFGSNIKIKGKTRHLGRFKTAEDAYSAYVQAKRLTQEGCTL
jgi:hypothetical protein